MEYFIINHLSKNLIITHLSKNPNKYPYKFSIASKFSLDFTSLDIISKI